MDTIANMLSGMNNAGKARKETVVIPLSKLKLNIAKALQTLGYVKAANIKKVGNHEMLEIVLFYEKDGSHKIKGSKRVSKPSKRVYLGVSDIKPVKFGTGALFISTPKGILTDREARKEMVGGEALFQIW